jgi:uncharacterized protein (TIRG00374 family)
MNRKAWLRFGLGVVISAGFIWLAFRGLDLGEIGRRMAGAKPADFGLSVAAFMVASVLRSWRWQLCFEPADGVNFGQSFGAYGLGSLSTQVIPARLGDLVRVYVLGQNAGVSKSKGLGTLVVERLSDMFAVVIIIALLLPTFALPGWIKTSDLFAAAVALVTLGVVYALARKGAAIDEPGWVAKRRPLQLLFRLLVQLINGFSAVKSVRRGLLILLLSFGVWLAQIANYLTAATAMDLAFGWREAALVTCVLALSAIIPAGPGFAGSFELAAVGTLALFSIDRLTAISYLELTRVISLVGLLVWGGAGLLALRMSRRTMVAALPLTHDEHRPAAAGNPGLPSMR